MNILLLIFIFVLDIHEVFGTLCPDGTTFNVFFVLDESGSVGQSNYEATVDFVIDFISNDINAANAGALAFGSSNDPVYSFGDDQASEAGILAALQAERNDFDSGGTNTRNALVVAINDFATNNIPTTDNNYIVLLNDGLSSQTVCSGGQPVSQLSGLATQNIRLILVALGGFNPASLSCLHGPGDLLTGDFSAGDFDIIGDQLENILCGETFNPTIRPTDAPLRTIGCPDGGPTPPYNLLFVLDESGSVNPTRYVQSIDFIIDIIQQDVDPRIAAAVAFGTNTDEIYSFGDDQSNRAGIIAALEAEKTNFAGSLTDTLEALQFAINEFQSNNIPATENNIVILVTDGTPNEGNVCSGNNKVASLAGLDTLNIRVIVVALGPNPSTINAIRSQLRCTFDDPPDFLSGDFNDFDFQRLAGEIEAILCSLPVPGTCPCYGELDSSLKYCLSGCCDVGVLAKTKDNTGALIDYGVDEIKRSCFIKINDVITTEIENLDDASYYDCEAILIEASNNNCTISDTIDDSIFSAIIALFNSIHDPNSDISVLHLVSYAVFILMILAWIIVLTYLLVSKIASKFTNKKANDYLNLPYQDETETTSVTEA